MPRKFKVLFPILFVVINAILITLYDALVVWVKNYYNIPVKQELFHALSTFGEYAIILAVSMMLINVLIPIKE